MWVMRLMRVMWVGVADAADAADVPSATEVPRGSVSDGDAQALSLPNMGRRYSRFTVIFYVYFFIRFFCGPTHKLAILLEQWGKKAWTRMPSS